VTAPEIAERLRARRSGAGWMAHCPGPLHAHQDRSPSLSISDGADGRILLHCFGGCETVDVLRAIGLTWRDVFPPRAPASRAERERQPQLAERAEEAAWTIYDRIRELRRGFRDALHRVERLQRSISQQILRAETKAEREAGWERLARLAPAAMFFLAAYDMVFDPPSATLINFALASPGERRRMILGE
jgi:hypothetical protein